LSVVLASTAPPLAMWRANTALLTRGSGRGMLKHRLLTFNCLVQDGLTLATRTDDGRSITLVSSTPVSIRPSNSAVSYKVTRISLHCLAFSLSLPSSLSRPLSLPPITHVLTAWTNRGLMHERRGEYHHHQHQHQPPPIKMYNHQPPTPNNDRIHRPRASRILNPSATLRDGKSLSPSMSLSFVCAVRRTGCMKELPSAVCCLLSAGTWDPRPSTVDCRPSTNIPSLPFPLLFLPDPVLRIYE
jgi:hypothetical protein